MNHLTGMAIRDTEKGIKSRYRLFPIIIGCRCEGYELQKEHQVFFRSVWRPVKGEFGGAIRCTQSEHKKLIEIATELERLAKHLSTITVLEFNVL